VLQRVIVKRWDFGLVDVEGVGAGAAPYSTVDAERASRDKLHREAG